MRGLIAALLAAGVIGLIAVPERQALLLGTLAMLLAFLLGSAKLAVDLVDLVRTDLIADAALLVSLGLAFARFSSGDRILITALLAVALATQIAPLALARRRLRKP